MTGRGGRGRGWGLQEPKTECAQRGDLEGSLQHTAESPEAELGGLCGKRKVQQESVGWNPMGSSRKGSLRAAEECLSDPPPSATPGRAAHLGSRERDGDGTGHAENSGATLSPDELSVKSCSFSFQM